jgi:hypothetical protein
MPTRNDDVNTRGTASADAGDRTTIERKVDEVLRHRMWFSSGQIRVRMREGTAVLTGDVGRRSTADIAARVASTVPGVDDVDDRIRFEFDDAELVRSRVGRTHPFSAEPFRPTRKRPRRRDR